LLIRLHQTIILPVIVITFLMCFRVSVVFAAGPVEKHILLLHSFSSDHPAHEQYNTGLKSKLTENSQYKFRYSFEYLNLARYPNKEEYFANIAQYLKVKYIKNQPDFIIASNDLYPLTLKTGQNLFPGVPVIIAWNEDNLPVTTMPANYVAIPQSIEVDRNIQLILKTRPLTKTIYIVIGDSVDERNKLKRVMEVRCKYQDRVEFVFLNKLPYEQMLEQIRNTEDDSAVLYLQWFSDVEGKVFVPAEVIQTICQEVKVPVYGINRQYLGGGMIGGYLNDFATTGQNAAQVVMGILSGQKPFDGQVFRAPAGAWIFDWRALKHWGINEHSLPAGCKIEYREIGVWEQYRGYIIGAAVVLILQTLTIIALLINRARRKRAEYELMQVDRLKDEFLANTSHELRTPLNGIINITKSILAEDTGNLTGNQRENLAIVERSGHRLYNLINDILDISRIKQGEIKLDLRPVDLYTTVSAVIHVLEFQLKGKDVTLHNKMPQDIPAVLADEERLGQILFNLIGNAVKFTAKGHVTASAEIKKGRIEVSIEDSGVGIPKEKLTYIFEAFTQVHSEPSRGYEGSGLGLPITQKLVELHGGRITVSSELNKGSNFIFSLPVSPDPADNVSLRFRTKVVNTSLVQHRTEALNVDIAGSIGFSILAVDDDPANLHAIVNVLAPVGYSLRGVNSGQAVLDLLDNGCKFDLLLLDIMMPEMTGFEVLKRLRERYSQIDLPVLILTARAQNEDLKAGLLMGANDFLKKPFASEELRARVKTLVQLKALVRDKVSAELLFLQAQIKPHFIFNALSVISSLSLRAPKKAKELVLYLSDYLRGSFNFKHDDGLTTLRKELELVRAYLAIEQVRFKQRLVVEFAIDDDVDCPIPMLSIQPLVENAVRHGIMPLIEGGKIRILVGKIGNVVKISVSDNGLGMEEEKVKGLLAGQGTNSGVGLINIHRRLIVLYGKGLEVTGGPGRGTMVELAIPLR